MSGTNSSGYNVRRHQAKSKHLNLYERLAGDISVLDITAGAIDALYSLHSRRGDLEQLRYCFNERLAVKGGTGDCRLGECRAVIPRGRKRRAAVLILGSTLIDAPKPDCSSPARGLFLSRESTG